MPRFETSTSWALARIPAAVSLGVGLSACSLLVDDSRTFEPVAPLADAGKQTLDDWKFQTPSYSLKAFRKSDTPQSGAAFGYPLQFLDDGALLVGSSGATAGGVVEAGKIYELSPAGAWNEIDSASAVTPTAHAGYPELALPVFYNVNPPGIAIATSGPQVFFGIAGEDQSDTVKDVGSLYAARRIGMRLGGVTRVPTTPMAGSGFGFTIAATDSVVMAGAPWEACDSGGASLSHCGAVHVFQRSGDTLSEVEVLHASHPAKDALFGASMTMSGNVLVVGAPGEPVAPEEPPTAITASSGAAYVFRATSTGVFTELRRLYPAGRTLNAYYGTAVAFDGHLLAVGSPSATSPGEVELFEYVENAMRPLTVLRPTDKVTGCGFSLALGDGVLVVGAPADQSTAGGVDADPTAIDSAQTGVGAVHVYDISGTQFSPLAYLKADHPDKLDLYGMTVATSGRFIAVGAPAEASKGPFLQEQPTDNSLALAGAVYLYERTTP